MGHKRYASRLPSRPPRRAESDYDWMEQAIEQLRASSPTGAPAHSGDQLDEIRQMLERLLAKPDNVVID